MLLLVTPPLLRGSGILNNETKKHYASAHLFVLPSNEEPYGAVVNEAISAELPLILSDKVGCHKDTLIDSRNGYLFKSGNSFDLAEKILKVLNNKDSWEKMCLASLEIGRKFDSVKITKEIKKSVIQVLTS